MEENKLSLSVQSPRHVTDIHRTMHKIGQYSETDKMCDLIASHYSMLLVMHRFGIAMGIGEKSIKEVCKVNQVDCNTFLTVVNFLLDDSGIIPNVSKCLSVESLVTYLQRSHDYFLNFRLPHIRRKLKEAIGNCPEDISFVIMKFFDEYASEVNKHMAYEEKVVFPYVQALIHGKRDPKYNIAVFRKKHDQIDYKLTELKNILIKYYPGQSSNLLNSVLFDIFSCERDLASHCKMEDNLFTPAILEIEKR